MAISKLLSQPAHETGPVVPGAIDRLPELDGVLRLEMAATEVVGARERDECELFLLVDWIERLL